MQDTLRSPYMDKLMGFLSTEYALNTIMPEKSKVFLPFKLCPWEDLKVVIIGHEPFHGVVSSGLAFGEEYVTRFHSQVICSIYDCIEREYFSDSFYLDFDFSLKSWASQGVLLLNRNLTSRKDIPDSHKKQWGKFNSAVLNAVNDYNPGTVFILWGNEAQALAPHINKNNYVLTFDDPNKYISNKDWKCPNFKECDKIMESLYGKTIIW